MNLNAKVFMGIRVIGTDITEMFEGPLNEIFKDMIHFLSKNQIKKRIDLSIGYEEKHIVNWLKSNKAQQRITAEEALEEVAEMMARIDAGETFTTDDPEDDYVPSYDSQAAVGRDEG